MSVRHDWYQSETFVVVTIFLKKSDEKDCHVKISREGLVVTAQNYNFDIRLLHAIKVMQSSYKVFPTKIEIRLMKETNERWTCLEFYESKPVEVQSISFPMTTYRRPSINKEDHVPNCSEKGMCGLLKAVYNNFSPEVRTQINKMYFEAQNRDYATNYAIAKEGWQKYVEAFMKNTKNNQKSKESEEGKQHRGTKQGRFAAEEEETMDQKEK
ncbi:protein SGT1 homolog [Teleopsis dalmanni]|uniref:protein SGT1 homolog n=1 Tax=Teleopsis dalmanni TaxID=139649 RepID=UPI0018CCBE30|nr:protein SGT1 homolog [Teleopsis dalmanni]